MNLVCFLHLHHFLDISATCASRRVCRRVWVCLSEWHRVTPTLQAISKPFTCCHEKRLWDLKDSTALQFIPFVWRLVFLKDLRVCEKGRNFISRQRRHDFHLLWTDSWKRSSWGIHWLSFKQVFVSCERKTKRSPFQFFPFCLSFDVVSLWSETGQTEQLVQLGT